MSLLAALVSVVIKTLRTPTLEQITFQPFKGKYKTTEVFKISSNRAHTVNFFHRSDGKDEKSEVEGKDGKGEKFGLHFFK